MSVKTQIELTPEALRTIRNLQQLPANMGGAIARVLDLENDQTVSRIQKTYMSRRGRNTLGVRTNRLRGSIRRNKAQVSGLSVISGIGSNVEYMGVHEFGYDGPQSVSAHTRRINHIFGVPSAEPIVQNVRAHTRQVSFPERAPIRKGIRDRLPTYGSEISRAIVEAATKS